MNLLSSIRVVLTKSVNFIIFSCKHVFITLSRFTTLLNVCSVTTTGPENEDVCTASGLINKGDGFAMSCIYFHFLFNIWFSPSTLVTI